LLAGAATKSLGIEAVRLTIKQKATQLSSGKFTGVASDGRRDGAGR